MGRLDDRVVLITGAAAGQGAAEACMARDEGAVVVLADVADEAGRALADELGADYHHLDVTSADEWAAVAAGIVEQHGRIDGLVNNAGIHRAHDLLDADLGLWNRIIAVNQTGTFLGMATVAPLMVEAGGGSIVNISSIAGMRGHRSPAYVASKWAVRGLTQSAATELGPMGIRVNSVHPGAIDTDMWRANGGTHETMAPRLPLRRVGEASEVASAVMFLLSDEASYMTGAELLVDGGMITR